MGTYILRTSHLFACRIPCVKKGGIRFLLNGNAWFNLVLVYNVAGAGAVDNMEMKGSGSSFFTMTRNWGENWELKQKLVGQPLAFRLTLSDNTKLTSNSAVPKWWRFGSTYECTQNF